MTYNQNQIQAIKDLHNRYLDNLLTLDFDELSNNQMAFIRCVSVSSIMAMKKTKKSNNDIMLSQIKDCNIQVSIKDRLAMMSNEELEALGLSRI